MQQLLRTQIYLPLGLRQEIDRDRREQGESLAAYLRKAAEERLANRKKKKADLKKLAEEIAGSSTRSLAEAKEWAKQVREDRQLEDEHWEKRWEEAMAKVRKNNKED